MHIIGLMSGTSLDGLDIAYCQIDDAGFNLLAAETYPFPREWVRILSSLEKASAYEYALAHVKLGHLFGRLVNRFRNEHPGPCDAIASHGHTIFHQPNLALTAQIGDGNAIAAETGLPVVYNFRALDVALTGQGAPLVPIGDQILFGNYDACLNLGGFSNISYNNDNQTRVAFDVCPCNMALNHVARLVNKEYDSGGAIARSGHIDTALLSALDDLPYYRLPLPKSLGKEWFVSHFLPLFSNSDITPSNLMRTLVEHIAHQISGSVKGHGIGTMLITGGGAKNRYLIARIQAMIPSCKITIPSDEIINYKEAIIFALLGYLRLNNKNNCLSSVTGAHHDNCGGDIAGISYINQ